jgi:hypothetical protein
LPTDGCRSRRDTISDQSCVGLGAMKRFPTLPPLSWRDRRHGLARPYAAVVAVADTHLAYDRRAVGQGSAPLTSVSSRFEKPPAPRS